MAWRQCTRVLFLLLFVGLVSGKLVLEAVDGYRHSLVVHIHPLVGQVHCRRQKHNPRSVANSVAMVGQHGEKSGVNTPSSYLVPSTAFTMKPSRTSDSVGSMPRISKVAMRCHSSLESGTQAFASSYGCRVMSCTRSHPLHFICTLTDAPAFRSHRYGSSLLARHVR